MPGNSFGQIFKITTFGESHGAAIGVVIDGCPPGIEIAPEQIQAELSRRRPGQSQLTTDRVEADQVEVLSGIYQGMTTGSPLALLVKNADAKSEDYDLLKDTYRPSHADYTYQAKYGHRDHRGGGRSSVRESIGRVAAGAIAQAFLAKIAGIEFLSSVERVGEISAEINYDVLTRSQIEASPVRCADPKASAQMEDLILELKQQGDSVGGVVLGLIKNVPVGLGEPVFDKLEADLAKAMLSIGSVKGFEIGSGFEGTKLLGSQHNDEFYMEQDRIRTRTNNSGGIQGGISNGEQIYFRVAFKPVSTISKSQSTVTSAGQETKLEASGRHDPCVLPRAVPIVDAMAALVIMDHYLRYKAITPA